MQDSAGLYSEYTPSGTLTRYVHCFWSYRANEIEPPQTVVPDGRAELIIHFGEPYQEEGALHPQPKAIFAGQLTQPLKLMSGQHSDILAVRFRPDGARPFLKRDVSTTTDRRIDMIEGPHGIPQALMSGLSAYAETHDRIQALSTYLMDRIGMQQPDPVVRQVVEAVMTGEPATRPDHITARQFQRRFRREVGVGERMLRSIRRFRSVFDHLSEHADDTWIRRALETGYFDQPQLARDFQRFLGTSASQWIKDATGLGLILGSAEKESRFDTSQNPIY